MVMYFHVDICVGKCRSQVSDFRHFFRFALRRLKSCACADRARQSLKTQSFRALKSAFSSEKCFNSCDLSGS